MELVQSFWSQPALDNVFGIEDRLKKELFVVSLSCWYAKNSGAKLTMYTDDYGMQLFDHLPYDDIVLKIKGIDVDSLAFAYPKFAVTKDLPLGVVHIDNDVFIKSEKCLNALKFDGYDCIVQSKDKMGHSIMHKETIDFYLDELTQCGFRCVANSKYEYNTGVIGFNNQELKDKYFDTYFKLIELSKDKIQLKAPDIIFEQNVLYNMAKDMNVKCLITEKVQADDINYQHVLSVIKWRHIDKIKALLKYYAPDIYDKTSAKVDTL